jgi:ArsR family transcriptional regulator
MRGDFMKLDYKSNAKIFKALSDQNRLKIIDILSCGEKCACDLLEHFEFTQPTLSHHMRVLLDCDLVKCRKEGPWSHYSLNNTNGNRLVLFLMNIITDLEDCVCKDKNIHSCETENKK